MPESPAVVHHPERRKRLAAAALKNWVAIVLAVVSLGYAGAITLLHSEDLSPVDEWVYVDYLYKLPAQGMVHEGEFVGDEALSILACEGTSPYGTVGPPCAERFDDTSAFPNEGLTSAAVYTPVYFAITRVVGDLIHWTTGIGEVESWRLTGPLWLAAGMVVFVALLRQWRVPNGATLALGLAFIASPLAWWTYTYVSTDAPSFLFGAALLLLATGIVRGRPLGWWLVLASVAAVLVKAANLLAVGVAALVLLTAFLFEVRRAHWTGWRTRRPQLPGRALLALPAFAVGSALAALVAQFAWLRVVGALAVSDLRADQGIAIPLSAEELLAQVVNFLPGALTYSPVSLYVPAFVYAPLSWLCVAGVLAAFWGLRRDDPTRVVVGPVAIAAVTFAPLLAIGLLLLTGQYFTLPSRYGVTLLAGFLLLAGLTMRNRVAQWVIAAYAVALLGLGLWFSGFLAATY